MRETHTGSVALFDESTDEVAFICHLSEQATLTANARKQGIDVDALRPVPITVAFDPNLAEMQVVHDEDAQNTDVYAFMGPCEGCGGNTFRNINSGDYTFPDARLGKQQLRILRVTPEVVASLCYGCVQNGDLMAAGCARAMKRAEQNRSKDR